MHVTDLGMVPPPCGNEVEAECRRNRARGTKQNYNKMHLNSSSSRQNKCGLYIDRQAMDTLHGRSRSGT